ncbi:pyridoxamine 5'-phosphate oxidase family protein [Kiloniella laminariae]|uniref:Pyridoxamine 5'-phosphate oxidase family protein n=1 Tax=Kiloniella laminariae TaxID=454162 RepID=A0ABT4LIR5_9PROT|nr:pyridoxamine 5'-phosphate oxidase family protein [Kiloniella laminariae]MCZ4281005.1 pyridoxamine 5'-phosphate oxidase family protein [Kiloniella laminariae]
MAEFFDPDTTPFHAGEIAVQQRVGVLEAVHSYAPRMVRDFLPDQHRLFYAQLSQLVIGSLDRQGRPWVSMVVGQPGFVSSPDRNSLAINPTLLSGDPLAENLGPDIPLGFLGIEFHTRRRNRLAGKVTAWDASGAFSVRVDQAFGNCPQYIQARHNNFEHHPDEQNTVAGKVRHRGELDAEARRIVSQADTFFIASAYIKDGEDQRQGVDASHRGGKPGFLKVVNNRTLLFPDFPGNRHFNTIGNIELYPKVGLLVPAFDRGDMLYLTGSAEIIWEGPEVAAFRGAERLVRITIDETVLAEKSLPMRWSLDNYSPYLEATGDWETADQIIRADHGSSDNRDSWRPYRVSEIEPESETVSSFSLVPDNPGQSLPFYTAGQHLPIRVSLEKEGSGRNGPEATGVRRNYTLSNAYDGRQYRLTVKREKAGRVSKFLHDQLKPGDIIEAQAPRGNFVLDEESQRPVVLLSVGVGITPMIAMLEAFLKEQTVTRNDRQLYFIHGNEKPGQQPFLDYLTGLGQIFGQLNLHLCYVRPEPGDVMDDKTSFHGRIDKASLQRFLPLGAYDFYLCGPADFMQQTQKILLELGVHQDRIRSEFFDFPAVLETGRSFSLQEFSPDHVAKTLKVRFARADIEVQWSQEQGTLLDLAEAAGLEPDFSCRSGTCGSCATKVRCGSVQHRQGISAPADGEALICSAVPAAVSDSNSVLVLDL